MSKSKDDEIKYSKNDVIDFVSSILYGWTTFREGSERFDKWLKYKNKK